jgi:transcriptional regulator of met regulon
VTWGECIDAMHSYIAVDSFDNALMKPYVTPHTNKKQYDLIFKIKSEIPLKTLYYVTKVIGSKKTKEKVKELSDYVNQCKKIG